MSRNIAIILAGGQGVRMGVGTPKQFLKVAGKKIVEHTLDVFEANDLIDEICIVCKSGYVEEMEQIVLTNQYVKVKKIIIGGAERYQSSLAAIKAYETVASDDDNLIFHDAVRPLVNNRIIEDCIKALEKYKVVDVAIKTTDTIVEVDEKNTITNIPRRSSLRNGQTPQCFKYGIIREAYEKALRESNFETTDDCGIVLKYMPQESIFVVEGEVYNMKLTHVEDLFLIDKLFQLRSTDCIGKKLSGKVEDSLRQGKVVVVFGGSYGIGKEIMKLSEGYNSKFYSFSRTENGVDVSDIESVKQALAEVDKKEGKIDAVICTAGVLYRQPLRTMNQEEIESSISINLLGIINVSRAAYDYLKRTEGSLLFFTSSSYTRGRMMYSVYSATKAAVVNFVQAVSEEWHSVGIRVNCINPERTKTPMRVKNFGNEPEGSLLDPQVVAVVSLNTVFSDLTGEVIDVKR